MNFYSHRFTSICPNNQKVIDYTLFIEAGFTIMVEDIVSACSHCVGYHEEIADELALGGGQTLTAHHHGVTITTTRGGV